MTSTTWLSKALFQNLELSEIEAIVAEIEREKEAGRLGIVTPVQRLLKVTAFIRGRAQEVTAGSNRCRPSRDGPESFCWRGFRSIVLILYNKISL